jgi:DNA-binding response OmpR family regulator
VKRDYGLRGVRVVLVTAKGQGRDVDLGFEAGADYYVTKPFTSAEIMKAAREMLDGTVRHPLLRIAGKRRTGI